MEYKWISQDYDGYVKKHIESTMIIDDIWFSKNRELICPDDHHTGIKDWQKSLINLETHDYKIENGILMKVEKEQIIKGSDLQYKDAYGIWCDCLTSEYRLKPKTKIVRFRNFLHIDEYVETCISEDDNVENKDYFVKWIGDWQEVEIEQ